MKFHQKKPTTIGSYAIAIAQTLESQGFNSKKILRQAGIDPDIRLKPDSRVQLEAMSRLWDLAVQATGDPCIGLSVGDHIHPASLHALGFAVLAGGNLYEGFKRIRRYFRIINSAFEFIIEESDGELAVGIDPHEGSPEPRPEAIDSFLATAIAFGRFMVNVEIRVKRIELIRKEPTGSKKYRVLFPAVPFRFSAGQNRIYFQKEDVFKPFPAANSEIARHNDKIVAEYLERFFESNIVHTTHKTLIELLTTGTPSIDKLAATVGMSKRCLNRHLRNENTSYREILNETRQILAAQYLNYPNLSVIDIAFRLGYSDSANFTRAFKRWYGTSPKTFRNRQTPKTDNRIQH